MNLQKNTFSPKYLYHYTTYERAQQILKEKTVQCYQDDFTFFTASHEDAVKVCYHVMKEGQECQHATEQVVITEATPQTDALGAEECTQCGKVFKYYDIPGTACASFMQNTADAIRKATTNEVLVDTRLWTCLDKRVTDALLERKDVSLTINYSYRGTRYTVTIPAGTNAAELLDENGYCGFRYLDLLYHGTTLNE